jgi:hypothetical protein
MRIVVGDTYSAFGIVVWFYYAPTKSIYHICDKMSQRPCGASIVYETQEAFRCPYCLERVPGFVELASCVSVSTISTHLYNHWGGHTNI